MFDNQKIGSNRYFYHSRTVNFPKQDQHVKHWILTRISRNTSKRHPNRKFKRVNSTGPLNEPQGSRKFCQRASPGEFSCSGSLLPRMRQITIEILSSEGGHLVYERNVGSTGRVLTHVQATISFVVTWQTPLRWCYGRLTYLTAIHHGLLFACLRFRALSSRALHSTEPFADVYEELLFLVRISSLGCEKRWRRLLPVLNDLYHWIRTGGCLVGADEKHNNSMQSSISILEYTFTNWLAAFLTKA